MRVYLPSTLPGLAALERDGELGPAPLTAHAVTPALRHEWGEGASDEELEYAALMAAAFDSLTRLGGEGVPARRVVVAADVPDDAVTAGDDETAVEVGVGVPLAWCRSVHVDEKRAAGDVAGALDRLPEALAGDGRALAAVSLVDHELLWFATQEIPDLL